MRRSAAPSQVLGSASKKPRFIPPGKSNTACLKTETEELGQEMKSKEVDEKQGSAPGHARTLSKIHCQNQNVNSTQSVESNVEVKTTKASNGLSKPCRLEMKTLNPPKADNKAVHFILCPKLLSSLKFLGSTLDSQTIVLFIELSLLKPSLKVQRVLNFSDKQYPFPQIEIR